MPEQDLAVTNRQKEIAEEVLAAKDELRKSDRQLAMVLDLNMCIGCQTCSTACKSLWTRKTGREYMWWNTVNTVPGKGTPKDWERTGGGGYRQLFGGKVRDPVPGRIPTRAEFGEAWKFNHKEVFYGGKGSTTQLKPEGKPTWGPNWDEDQGGGTYPNSFFFYLPRLCNHCKYPACLDACPRNAIGKRKEDGSVQIDQERCKGYRFCVEACPYKKIYFNFITKKSQKCIFCFPRVEKGVAPACARMCPGRVRFVGFLDDEDSAVNKLISKWKVAIPLHPEYGTEPNVFYVPPLSPPRLRKDGTADESAPRIPIDFLRYMFGTDVDQALETLTRELARVRSGATSELMDTLISRHWLDRFPELERDPAEIEPIRSPGQEEV